MQITETKNQGLSREFSITILANDIQQRINAKLNEIGKSVKLPGFRPGKIPLSILRQRFTKNVLGEVIEGAVDAGSQKILSDWSIRPAMQPRINIEKYEDGKDLVFVVAVDVMPDIDFMDFSKIKLTRKAIQLDDVEVQEALEKIAKNSRKTQPISKKRALKKGDVAVIDFVGRIDNNEFEGGSGENHNLEIGSNSFIPGFEDQLVGGKTGDKIEVNVTFPAEYQAESLAGKDAVFSVEIKEIREFLKAEINDDLAVQLGLETLEELKTRIREKLKSEYDNVARAHMKRDLLDILHDGHKFDVPGGMVDLEFEQIWTQLQQARDAGQIDEEDKNKSDAELKETYREIASRRVALGLLISEVGNGAKIEVPEKDINLAILQESKKFPGKEMEVFKHFQDNPQARANLQAPLFEERVVDHIIAQANIVDKPVTSAEMLVDEVESQSATTKKAVIKKTASKKPKSSKIAESNDKAESKKATAKKATVKKAVAKKASTKKASGKKPSGKKPSGKTAKSTKPETKSG